MESKRALAFPPRARQRKALLGLAMTCTAMSAQAAIIGVTDNSGPSSLGGAAEIIAAPTDVLDGTVTNSGQQGFNEVQGFSTTVAHATDTSVLAAGTLVDSHMIFFNRAGSGDAAHFNVTWTFSGDVIGVMSDTAANLEAASTFELGAPGTNYPGAFPLRGLENNGDPTNSEGYSVSGNMLTVGMAVNQPGDWIRVLTAPTAIPTPGALLLLLPGLWALHRRRSRG